MDYDQGQRGTRCLPNISTYVTNSESSHSEHEAGAPTAQQGLNFQLISVEIITLSLLHNCHITQLEALRERRPPWLRQIITLILPTVKMLSLGSRYLNDLRSSRRFAF